MSLTVVFKEGISKGLRKSARNPKNNEFFTELSGMFHEEGILRTLEIPDQVDTSALDCTFPFPQIFRLVGFTLVCTSTTIYRLDNGVLTSLISVAAGTTWSLADFGAYIIMTNGRALVKYDFASGTWGEYVECAIPNCVCLCAFKGQLFVGGPEVSVSEGFFGE